MSHDGRYFIGYALHLEEAQTVEHLRELLEEQFAVRWARRTPPHITLFPPFETPDTKLLQTGLSRLAAQTPSISVPTIGFNHFRQHVWFIDLDAPPILFHLYFGLEKVVLASTPSSQVPRPRPPHFHITLATKDIPPSTFSAIKQLLAQQPLLLPRIRMDHLSLYRYHLKHGWIIEQQFPFQKHKKVVDLDERR